MADFASEVQRPPSGCGIQGCLFAAVALFVLLMVSLLVIAVFRFSEPPQGVRMPFTAVSDRTSDVGDPLSDLILSGEGEAREPTTDSGQPTAGVEERKGAGLHA